MALITTTHGLLEEALLEKREGEVDDENEHTTWVEYWMRRDDRCAEAEHDVTIGDDHGTYFERVHRSAHVTLKKMPAMFGEAGGLG